MNSEHDVVPEREDRLDEDVTSYLEAVETGQAPDRQVWLARYPELAAELSDFFADQDRLDRLAAPLRAVAQGLASTPPPGDTPFPNLLAVGPDSDPAAPPGAGSRTIDDYKLIREVGRGGMGVVYEAEQISLSRRVALKVLPFAATMDARHLQRFQNEARAAASLEHPHIVPVYGVGCERGVHYYAMKFINGQSLAEMIHRQRADSASGVSDRPGPDTSGVASATGAASGDALAPGATSGVSSPSASGASNRPGLDASADASAPRVPVSENLGAPASEIASLLVSEVASAPRVPESENP